MERPIEPTTGDSPPPGTTGPYPRQIGEAPHVGTPHAPGDDDDDEQRRGADRTDECEEIENERYAG